jgi:cell division protein FtsW
VSLPRIIPKGLKNPFKQDIPLVTTLFSVCLLLLAFGLLMVLSASAVTSGINNNGNFLHDAGTQLLGASIGLFLCLVIAKWPIWIWQRYRNLFVFAGIALQALVLMIGESYGGNKNWLNLGVVSIQPSEFLKLAVIVWFASWIHDNEDWVEYPLENWKEPLFFIGFPLILVGAGGDLGTAFVLALIIAGMLFIAGFPTKYLFVGAVALLGLAVVYGLATSASRSDRLLTFFKGCTPEQYEGVCWQTIHGIWAVASGGIGGLGIGSSRAKWSWLPHADSDYIFAIIAEELGLVGALFLFFLIALLAVTLVKLIRAFPQLLTRVLITGVFMWLIMQSLINIAVVLGMIPVLGVPLPFVSSGGSSLVANLLAIGVIISCVRYEEHLQ